MRLGRLVDTHDGGALGLELERARLEAGDRGVELGKIHGVCLSGVERGARYLAGTGHEFFTGIDEKH